MWRRIQLSREGATLRLLAGSPLERIRTADAWFRRPALCPLSYKGMHVVRPPALGPEGFIPNDTTSPTGWIRTSDLRLRRAASCPLDHGGMARHDGLNHRSGCYFFTDFSRYDLLGLRVPEEP